MRFAWTGAIVLAFAVTGAGDAAQDLKVLDLLDVQDAASLNQPRRFNPVLTCNADLGFEKESSGKTWIKASLRKPDETSEQEFSAVFFEMDYAFVVPPFDERKVPDGTAEWINVWLGYDRFAFDYRNEEKEPVRAVVLIQDWFSWLSRNYDGLKAQPRPEGGQKELPQLYEEEVVLNPGAGTIEIGLRKPLWCNNKLKGLGLDNIKAFGICIKSPDKERVIRLNRFRLESKDKNAGVFTYPRKVACGKCARGFSDEYAPFCPFCGAAVASYTPIPKELPDLGGCVLLKPTDGARGTCNSGGGDNLVDRIMGSRGRQLIAHYDVYYNKPKGSAPPPARKRAPWESNFCFKFALGSEFAAKPKIRKATLWLQPGLRHKKEEEFRFSAKPWLPGLLVYAVAKEYHGWTGSTLSIRTLPPYEKLVYVSGQHPGSSTQNPKLRATDKEPPVLLPIDLTEYVREGVTRGDPTLSFTLKAFTPVAAVQDPHSLGHCFDFPGLEDPRGPFIAVELEK
jgi:hypothetical protein